MAKETIYETFSPEETRELGRRLGTSASPGDVFTLAGELGAGKTVFAQGIAEGLGIKGPVTSPTFTILQAYEEGRMPFYHFDVYRIGSAQEMDDIGYDDFFYGDGICVIEWPGRIAEILPRSRCDICIEGDFERGCGYRRITFRQVDGGDEGRKAVG